MKDKENVVYTYNGILFSLLKNGFCHMQQHGWTQGLLNEVSQTQNHMISQADSKTVKHTEVACIGVLISYEI